MIHGNSLALTPGTRLGVYEVLVQIGVGGMGEVYRARDMKLGRDVAVKVLPEALAADPERIARFEREAKVLASLNHPNIAALFSMEQAGPAPHSASSGQAGSGQAARHFLVMELVEGDTVEELIAAQGPGLKAQGTLRARASLSPKP